MEPRITKVTAAYPPAVPIWAVYASLTESRSIELRTYPVITLVVFETPTPNPEMSDPIIDLHTISLSTGIGEGLGGDLDSQGDDFIGLSTSPDVDPLQWNYEIESKMNRLEEIRAVAMAVRPDNPLKPTEE